jgi:hypothetical protein
MHYLIRVIGQAESQEEAHENALAFVDDLIERREFDYYDLDSPRFEENGRTHRVVSSIGQLLVQDALKGNREAFDRALYAVRMMLAHYTDEQVYLNDFPDEPRDYYGSRHEFAVVGGYTHDCYLYGDDTVWGEKIQNDKDYALAIQDLDPNELWVTSLDVHC